MDSNCGKQYENAYRALFRSPLYSFYTLFGNTARFCLLQYLHFMTGIYHKSRTVPTQANTFTIFITTVNCASCICISNILRVVAEQYFFQGNPFYINLYIFLFFTLTTASIYIYICGTLQYQRYITLFPS